MAEPFSVSWGLLTLAVNVGYGFLGNAAYANYREFLQRWQDAGTDPATGLPRNRELREASLNALRDAAQVLVMELAGRLDPAKPWLPRIIDHAAPAISSRRLCSKPGAILSASGWRLFAPPSSTRVSRNSTTAWF